MIFEHDFLNFMHVFSGLELSLSFWNGVSYITGWYQTDNDDIELQFLLSVPLEFWDSIHVLTSPHL